MEIAKLMWLREHRLRLDGLGRLSDAARDAEGGAPACCLGLQMAVSFLRARRGWNEGLLRTLGLGESGPLGGLGDVGQRMVLAQGTASMGMVDDRRTVGRSVPLHRRCALIAGTSTWHMLPMRERLFVCGYFYAYP